MCPWSNTDDLNWSDKFPLYKKKLNPLSPLSHSFSFRWQQSLKKKCLHVLSWSLFPSVTFWEETSLIKTVICFLVYSFFFWFVIMLVHFTVSVLVCWLCCPIDVLIPSRESIKLLFLLFLSWVTGADQLKCTFTWNISLQWTVKLDTIIIALNLVIQSYYDKSAKATCAGNTAYVARKRT